MPELDKLVWTAGVADQACPAGSWRTGARAPRSTATSTASTRTCRRASCARQAKEALPDFIQPRIQHEAVRRIREHKRRGDRVILITGALDFLVESLQHLGDELIAARLVERVGRFTGELAEPPLTADGRASARRAPGRRPRRRPRRLPRLRRQPRRPAAARARRPPARDQPGLPAQPRGAAPALADRDLDDRAGRGMKALTYTPTPAKYVATRAGLPGAGALALEESARRARPAPTGCPCARG